MEDNPYSTLIKNIRSDMDSRVPTVFQLGRVSVGYPSSLKIDVAGTIQEADTLLKSNTLGILYQGDRVLLLPIEDEQRYIVLCKVVNI